MLNRLLGPLVFNITFIESQIFHPSELVYEGRYEHAVFFGCDRAKIQPQEEWPRKFDIRQIGLEDNIGKNALAVLFIAPHQISKIEQIFGPALWRIHIGSHFQKRQYRWLYNLIDEPSANISRRG